MINENLIKEYWYDMIKIRSITGEEAKLAEYVAEKLKEFGLEPKMSYYEGDEEKQSPSVYAVLDSGKPGPRLMLIGHIDTVKVANGWNTDPFTPTEVGDKTYGLGAMDMKGGLAAILATTKYYSENKDKFTGELVLAFVSDEENLSKGTYQLVNEGLSADMAIMAECRFDNMAIGFRGRYSIEVTISGKAAHASHYPNVGENALISGSKLAIAIEELPTIIHPTLGGGTWVVRSIEGGVKNALIVPEKCDLFIDRYTVPGETYEVCEKQILEAAEKLGLASKVDVRLKPRNSAYMEPFALEESHILVQTVKETFKEVTGNEIRIEFDKSVCDSNILANSLDIPTVTFGPSGGNMHGANEYGHIHQVLAATEIYIKTVSKLSK